MDKPETKTCRQCAETIKAAARVCPRCRRDQRALVISQPWAGALAMLLFAPMAVIMFIVAPVSILSGLRPGRDFTPFQAQLVVLDSKVRHVTSNGVPAVITVGTISNCSPHAWCSLQLEVQYFSTDGKLIDTVSQVGTEDEILSGASRGFKIRADADHTESAYVSHRVFVRAAREPRNRM